MQLPPELDFLAPFLVEPTEAYRYASWLLNDFDAHVWEYSFDYKHPKTLDWQVTLDDGTLLTDTKNRNLMLGFKYYLTSCTRDDSGYLQETNEVQGQQLQRFCHACHVLDFLLINGKRYQLGKYGLEGLTAGNLIEILQTLADAPVVSESVYNWNERLREHCLTLVKETSSTALAETLQAMPQLAEISDEQRVENNLGIDCELIPNIRAALYLKGFYHKQVLGNQPNTTLLSQAIYPEVLWGKNQPKVTYDILIYNDDLSQFEREFPGAPVTSGAREKMRDSTYAAYRRAVYHLGVLHELELPAPRTEALVQAEKFHPDLSTIGRYRTLPSDMVFKGLRQAIEFHLDYGHDLTKAFCRIALECRKRGISPSTLTGPEVQQLVGPKLAAFGVSKLSLVIKSTNDGTYQSNTKGTKKAYFESLRANRGFYELIGVYVGCVQLTVGILMARRVSELYGLNAKDCLDETEEWLLFRNAKSTRHLFGMRRREARPIEPVAADMIKTLIRMQKVLRRIGYIPKLQTLFAMPSFQGAARLTDSSAYMYNRNMDIFCDYFETPLTAEGERHYFRQHQMRRFFAMLFFYCGSFAKLDTLQWMLGHADPKHVYRYITESTDGAVLASAKAQVVAEELHQGNYENFLELTQLLKERYGTEKFTLISTNDLEDQIVELMEEGWIEIEPEFFRDHEGNKFKIVARFKRVPEAA
ncbi:integrase [Pseudomonas tolaasii]|uniref:integrase n=1 Tax=Pseudomonas tolaasii TaxID=29442 RepID=UPI0027333772|nr:integrase [Pseudomonas tolaasii]WLH51290.1 integrase [Pseudomonas tolaasii]